MPTFAEALRVVLAQRGIPLRGLRGLALTAPGVRDEAEAHLEAGMLRLLQHSAGVPLRGGWSAYELGFEDGHVARIAAPPAQAAPPPVAWIRRLLRAHPARLRRVSRWGGREAASWYFGELPG
jgi:hypothetical protein